MGRLRLTASKTRWTLSLALATALSARADPLSFFWYFGTQDQYTIPSCNTLQIGFASNPNATVQPVPPYYLIAYTPNTIPSVFNAGDGASPFSWRAAFPAGNQLLISLVDSQGNSGGVGPVYSIVAGQTCDYYNPPQTPLTFSLNPAAQPATCQEVAASVSGGTPPYTLTRIVSGDTSSNQTFSNSSPSYINMLSGGATYMISLSDSQENVGAASGLIYSGGGSNNTCLVDGGKGSGGGSGGGSNKDPQPGDNGSDHGFSGKTAGILGGVGAITLLGLLIAGYIFYKRRMRKQRTELLAAAGRAHSYNHGGPYSPSDGFPVSPGGTYLSDGREKQLAGGMWRPESPVDYPGIANVPVRFRVTNPDDDAASARRAARESEETIRSGRSRADGDDYSSERDASGRYKASNRRSLIEEDHNALYPPTHSHFSMTTVSSASGSGRRRAPSSVGDDEAWPTYQSTASSTEDHYMDHPASSAGILSGQSSANNLRSPNSSSAQTRSAAGAGAGVGSPWRQVHSAPSETDVEEVYSEVDYAESEAPSRMTRTNSAMSGNSSWESPFADTRRVPQ